MSAVVSITSLRLAMHSSFISICICWVMLAIASPVWGEVKLSEKHLIILRAGLDSVWGEYIFSVQNSQQEPQPADIALFLPRETVDFKAIEGVTVADLRVDAQHGTVTMQKEFPTGATLVNVAFKVAAQDGAAILNWGVAHVLTSVNVMYEHKIIEVFSDKLEATQLPRISDVHFRALHTTQALTTGDSLQVQVRGIPRGRAQLYLFAIVFVAILLISTVYLGISTRPCMPEGKPHEA